MLGRESVVVTVKTIRNTGALDDLWSVEGSREHVVDELRSWLSRTDGSASGPDLVQTVTALPPPPQQGSWLNAAGVTAGSLWVWATSADATTT